MGRWEHGEQVRYWPNTTAPTTHQLMLAYVPNELLCNLSFAFYGTCKRYRAILPVLTVFGIKTNAVSHKAALDGQLWLIKRLVDNGYTMDFLAAIYAAAQGHLEILKVLSAKGFAWRYAIIAASETGQVATMKWLYQSSGLWPKEVSLIATRHLDMEILEFVHKNNLPWQGAEEGQLAHAYQKEILNHLNLYGSSLEEARDDVLPAYAELFVWLAVHASPGKNALQELQFQPHVYTLMRRSAQLKYMVEHQPSVKFKATKYAAKWLHMHVAGASKYEYYEQIYTNRMRVVKQALESAPEGNLRFINTERMLHYLGCFAILERRRNVTV